MKLLKVDTLEQAREKLLAQITWDMGKTEKIPVEKSGEGSWPVMFWRKVLFPIFQEPQ